MGKYPIYIYISHKLYFFIFQGNGWPNWKRRFCFLLRYIKFLLFRLPIGHKDRANQDYSLALPELQSFLRISSSHLILDFMPGLKRSISLVYFKQFVVSFKAMVREHSCS